MPAARSPHPPSAGNPSPLTGHPSASGGGSQRTLHHFWALQPKRHRPLPAAQGSSTLVQTATGGVPPHVSAQGLSPSVLTLPRTVPAMIQLWEDRSACASSTSPAQSRPSLLAGASAVRGIRPLGVLHPPHPFPESQRDLGVSEPAGAAGRFNPYGILYTHLKATPTVPLRPHLPRWRVLYNL